MVSIAYISDEATNCSRYKSSFQKQGCKLELVKPTELTRINESTFDGIIIEENERISMINICHLLLTLETAKKQILVWVLTRQMTDIDRIVQLQLGIVGHLYKESPAEENSLIVRNSVLRRGRESALLPKRISPLVFKLEPKSLSVFVGEDIEISLTKLEYKLLECLVIHSNEVVSYEVLYQSLWSDSYNGQKYRISNIIFKIRMKFEKVLISSNMLKTVRTIGYSLDT